MPRRAAKPCGIPCCPHLRPCPVHGRIAEREYEQLRGSAPARGYGRRWRAHRDAFLLANPSCVACGAPATVADHITRRRELVAAGVSDPDHESLLQPLCAVCHGRKTAAEERERRRRRQKSL